MRPLHLPTLALLVLAFGCAEAGESPNPTEPVLVRLVETKNFGTPLSGDEEVPARDTRARGVARFQLNEDGTAIEYRLITANIENVTQAHIHGGAFGANGGIVAWLYPSAPPSQLIPGRSDGILAEGTITAANLRGALVDQPLSALIDLMEAGGTYVNVHTTTFPGGEVRGQVEAGG